MLNAQDLKQIQSKGISESQINEQLESFRNGFPFLEIECAASVEKGILKLNQEKVDFFMNKWSEYLNGENRIVKFVPASGAASRMFKDLFEFVEAKYDVPTNSFEQKFFIEIENFAFYEELNQLCEVKFQKNIARLCAESRYKEVVSTLLDIDGLKYGILPKGLLKFHLSDAGARTPMEEHLVEGALYAANKKHEVNVHFTVSTEHRSLFEDLVSDKLPSFEEKFGVKFIVAFSEQKPATDTIAADENNEPFRDKEALLFRPGGHGALIENLNDISADVIFVKNIDNVVPDNFKSFTVEYKKVIAGVLVAIQKQIHEYLHLIDSGKYTTEQLVEIIHFLRKELCIRNNEVKNLEDSELAIYLKHKLNRPIRVCGMVRNIGEPGGGPFIAQNQDGTWSLQILESSQIDLTIPEKKELLNASTHFNPVDLVCAVKDYKGNKFDLTQFVDKNTGFISLKSKSGKGLKALELPGLWNGAMSDWNTIFVEVPIETFNPVKTVNDLLRKEHQN
ncbi:MAG: DUF4301 family protein [Bacteroidales bacterium]|nr:DUF4301 family protein [Bacteroidales bacterium]